MRPDNLRQIEALFLFIRGVWHAVAFWGRKRLSTNKVLKLVRFQFMNSQTKKEQLLLADVSYILSKYMTFKAEFNYENYLFLCLNQNKLFIALLWFQLFHPEANDSSYSVAFLLHFKQFTQGLLTSLRFSHHKPIYFHSANTAWVFHIKSVQSEITQMPNRNP